MALARPEILKNIAKNRPNAMANSALINGLYQARFGKNATPAEIEKFSKMTAADASNIVLGAKDSPYSPQASEEIRNLVEEKWRVKYQSPYKNIPKDFDTTGMSEDQLKTLDLLVGKMDPEKTGVDISAITQKELDGYIKDAQNALDPYYKQKEKDVKDQYAIERKKLQGTYEQKMAELGITDTRMQAEVAQNLVRLGEDRNVALGNIDRNLVENVRQEQDDLESQGLTFSGEAVRQLGGKSAFVTGREGEILKTARLGKEDVQASFERQTSDQQRSLTQAQEDIARAKAAAQSEYDLGGKEFNLGEDIALRDLVGERSKEARQLVEEELGTEFDKGRTLAPETKIKIPKLA